MWGKTPTARVRSTLPEALAAPSGVERKPVTSVTGSGDADAEGRADDELSEADGTGAATPPKAASRGSDTQPDMALK